MLEATLTERAASDRDWLQRKLGARLGPPVRTPHPFHPDQEQWEVEVLKMDHKRRWFYGDTLEDIYGRIRAEAERAIAAKRRRG